MAAPARRVLVTGAAGFVGRYALAALAAAGVESLLGVGRGTNTALPEGAAFRTLDLADQKGLAACLRAFRPSHVLHLAAQASVGQADGAGLETWRTNVAGLLNLAEAMRTEAPTAALVFASSSEVYGRAFLTGQPVDEDVVPQPVGVYARTKRVGEEMLADVLTGSEVRLIVLRPFNHTGPGQDERFVVPAFAHQIARIEAGRMPPYLAVGNLEAYREFLDVRDVARAYAQVIGASDKLASGTVLNVATGHSRTIASVLEDLTRQARVPFEVVVDPARMRPSGIPLASGEGARLHVATGWAPQVPWSETLAAVLADARARNGA
ncbi:NAD-dependent epimerase/dehydratase family protein [Methylobacterium sp. E-016]|uniref:NAD-dependent epimerase/dehydratase family protein n=1 Tax=Methylobacterium sp. E-016 TaxID=2836556 RepID=UPI001FB99908|nr:NAD-dependent epimerase/dehydratase family protein [Methylobacterium sp. E-016]MCJ2079638.1 NAD-dependent epimerase/dehydratase family protein [Methylobacterium sp. E-016]